MNYEVYFSIIPNDCIGRSMAHEYDDKSLMEFTEAYDMISN